MTTPTDDLMTLECNVCSEPVFTADEDGFFYQDESKACSCCSTICQVEISDTERAYAYVSDTGHCADVGQPKCDGSCGTSAEFIGSPGNTYDCERCRRAPPRG